MNRWIVVSVLFAFLCPAVTNAQEEEDEDTVYPVDESVPSQKCIRPRLIRATEVIDDRNILFYLRGKQVFRNVLPRRCRGLERGGAFSYNSRYGRLCSVDSINVLGPTGYGLEDGRLCGLGVFYPMNEAEVKAIRLEAARLDELGLETAEEP